MPHDPAKLLWDMSEAAGHIAKFTQGKSFDDYLGDVFFRSAVERQFEIIGEAMTRLIATDIAVAQRITDFRKISRFRNALIHGYDATEHVISWGIIQTHLPVLVHELAALQKSLKGP